MNQIRRVALVLLGILSACSGPRVQQNAAQTTADSVIGTWRVVSHMLPASRDSESLRNLEPTPRGYLVYDATGHMYWQVQRRGAADSLALRHWADVPDSLLKPLLAGFQAYFGTYAVDDLAHVITHRIEGEFLPRSGHVEVATPFRFSGDTLTLGADSLERWIFVRVR